MIGGDVMQELKNKNNVNQDFKGFNWELQEYIEILGFLFCRQTDYNLNLQTKINFLKLYFGTAIK